MLLREGRCYEIGRATLIGGVELPRVYPGLAGPKGRAPKGLESSAQGSTLGTAAQSDSPSQGATTLRLW
jgi:hypothetical protein